MINSDRIGGIFMPIVTLLVIVFLIFFIYGLMKNDRFNDEDTITITFSCPEVLSAGEQYPSYVVAQCRKLMSKPKVIE